MAELDGDRVTAVLTADTAVHGGTDFLTQRYGHIHQLTNTVLIQLRERIVLVDLGVLVSGQELAGIVTAEAKGHLGQVVGAEAEELSFLRNVVCGQAGTPHGTVSAFFGSTL